MSAIFDEGPPPPCPAPFNMAEYVLAAGAACPEKIALSVLSPVAREDWTFAKIRTAVFGIAAGLRARGLAPGDRVLLRLGNTPETPLAYLGAIAADLVPVPTSTQLTEAETADIIAELAPGLILHQPGVPCPDHPVRLDAAALHEMHRNGPAEPLRGDPDRPAYIVYTSGTSGRSRAVVHAHRAIWARRMMHRGWYGLGPDDRILHAGAFNWTYTMGTGLMDPWSVGATALIPAPDTDPAALPGLIATHRATIFAAAPGVYRKMLAAADRIDAPDLRHGLSAGEKLGDGIRTMWENATGRAVHEAFGMSECSTFLSASPDRPAAPGTLGRPQQGRRVAIVDAAGNLRPHDTPGIVAVSRRDPGLMLGYHAQPDETAARFRGEWFLTGDEGAMAADGSIRYLGRADDMMNAGGYRVSPLEVEAAFAGLPGLDALAVTDIEVKPDVRLIMAFYTAPAPLDPEALAAHAASRLAGYKCPRDYIHLQTLPAGPNGKLVRRALKDMWKQP